MRNENDPQEASEYEEEEEDQTLVVPTTDLPEITLVVEDEYTEKIDESDVIKNIREVQQSLEQAERENKVNESVETVKEKEKEEVVEQSKEESQEKVEETKQETGEFAQPEVEVITAAEKTEVPPSPGGQKDTESQVKEEQGSPTPPPPKLAFQEETSNLKENSQTETPASQEESAASTDLPVLGIRVLFEL